MPGTLRPPIQWLILATPVGSSTNWVASSVMCASSGSSGSVAREAPKGAPTYSWAMASPPGISRDELQLAARNHGLPLEDLRDPITPLGLHYLFIDFEIPT